MLFNSLDYYFSDNLDAFIRMHTLLYRNVYKEERDRQYCIDFIKEVMKVLKDTENYKTMFSLPEDIIEITRQYLGVYEGLESFNYAAIGRRLNIKPYQADRKMYKFTTALKNELCKRLYNRCCGPTFIVEEIGKEKSVGIHVLELSALQYSKISNLNYNTIEDIVSTTLEEFREISSPCVFYDVVEKVHMMSYKFKDELSFSTEELIARDIQNKKERLGFLKAKTLSKLQCILNTEESLN